MEEISTKILSDELSKRPGVTQYQVEPHEAVKITIGERDFETTGPAVILINRD